jgi:hypothetical protein
MQENFNKPLEPTESQEVFEEMISEEEKSIKKEINDAGGENEWIHEKMGKVMEGLRFPESMLKNLLQLNYEFHIREILKDRGIVAAKQAMRDMGNMSFWLDEEKYGKYAYGRGRQEKQE